MSKAQRTALISVAVYLVWMAATYLFEGRVNMMARPTSAGRALYVLIANVVIGIGLAGWVLRSWVASGVVTLRQLGLRPLWRTIVAILIAGLAGFGLFLLQNPPSRDPIVVLNAFAQVLTVSIAEVVVCWALIGATFEGLTRTRGRWVALIVGIVAADLFFGVYHFAHSAPFNQLNMVFFLMIPGLVTGLVYFVNKLKQTITHLARQHRATVLRAENKGIVDVVNSVSCCVYHRPNDTLGLCNLSDL
jgi:hypothetical protein